jgi:hypothetical protein
MRNKKTIFCLNRLGDLIHVPLNDWRWSLLYNSENSAPGEPEPGLLSLRVPPLLPQGMKIQCMCRVGLTLHSEIYNIFRMRHSEKFII